MTISDINTLTSLSDLLLAQAPKNYQEILFFDGKPFNPPTQYFYSDGVDGYFNLFVVESESATSPVYLFNWLSQFIQIVCNHQVNIITLRDVQEWIHQILKTYLVICQTRVAFYWWLMFNPYSQPFESLRITTDWYLNAFHGVIPGFLGVDFSPSIGLGLLGYAIDIIGRLAFTMPYLPKEGMLLEVEKLAEYKPETQNNELLEMINEFGQNVRVFRGLPELWKNSPIPDSLREHWFTDRPEITEFLLKTYVDENYQPINDFLPNRILKEYYDHVNQIGQSISFNSVPIDFHEIKNLSTSLLCWFNETNIIHFNLN